MKLYKYRLWCSTEQAYKYVWSESGDVAPAACPTDTGHTLDGSKTVIVDTSGGELTVRGEQADKAVLVAESGREGTEFIFATHDFADKTTWYGESVRVTGQALSDDGAGTVWSFPHQNLIDLVHGKVYTEEKAVTGAPGGHGYAVKVYVDGVEKSPRAPFATSGGFYEVNYALGKVTFYESQAGKTVTADYSYAAGSTWTLKANAGKVVRVEHAEVQFSEDCTFEDTIRMAAWGLVDVFAPELMPGIPSGTKIELRAERYLRMHQMVDGAVGSYPTVAAMGGPRGMTYPMRGFPFRYGTVMDLNGDAGMELRISLEGNNKFGGERATATFYGIILTV